MVNLDCVEKEMMMASSKSFDNVTQAVWDCVKAATAKERGTTYQPPDSNQGTATTKVPAVGTLELGFDLDPGKATVTYTIISKPWIVTEDAIWNGIQDSINGCSS